MLSGTGNVYDVTEFLDGTHNKRCEGFIPRIFLAEHPGGARIILKYGGKDATEGNVRAAL